MTTYELHPLCTLFPRMSSGEFDALRDDIRANGLRQPITLHQGMILDGGNRYRACIDAGIEPTFCEFDGANIVSFVLSANLHRRHMTAGQQAAIVASAQDWARAQTRGGDRKSDQTVSLPFDSVASRATESGASDKTQRLADKVAREAPELAAQVGRGEISLPAAVEKITGKRPGARTRPQPEPEPQDYGPSDDEIIQAEAQAKQDSERVSILLASDDALAAMTAKCEQQAALIRTLESRVRGLQGEVNSAINLVKMWRTKFEKLEKECKKDALGG